MKTVRSSLRQLSWSPSPELLASRFWSSDAAATRRRRRIPGETFSGLTAHGSLVNLFKPCSCACLPAALQVLSVTFELWAQRRDAARATILEQRWHEMEVGRPVSAGGFQWASVLRSAMFSFPFGNSRAILQYVPRHGGGCHFGETMQTVPPGQYRGTIHNSR
eukprot:superscaffoldBa00005272_g20122